MKFPWKSAWIIGASSGLGAETAKQLSVAGTKTIISARSHDKLDQLSATSENLLIAPLDITDQTAVDLTVDEIVTDLGKLPDLIILNAAIYTPMNNENFNVDEIQKMMNVNYMGTVNVINALLKHKCQNGKVTIAVVTSPSGWRGLPNSLGYAPTKAALINLVEGLKSELYESSLDFRLVNPGFIKTRLTAKNNFPMPQLMEAGDAAQRMLNGLRTQKFDITFPNPLLLKMKVLRLLPYSLYFKITKNL